MTAFPPHIAFIMDGNGRWAERQGLPRLRGHERGADVLREITEFCTAEGLREVTFYALSTENYRRRPLEEVAQLMELLVRYLETEQATVMRHGIRFRTIGRVDELPPEVLAHVRALETMSADNPGMVLRLALNYGGRREITDAVRKLAVEIGSGQRSARSLEQLTESEFQRYLYDPEMTDPDLLVRTAGEYRLSNFLLWHISYAELWVTETPWPDFDTAQLRQAAASFDLRERKFGQVRSTVSDGSNEGDAS